MGWVSVAMEKRPIEAVAATTKMVAMEQVGFENYTEKEKLAQASESAVELNHSTSLHSRPHDPSMAQPQVHLRTPVNWAAACSTRSLGCCTDDAIEARTAAQTTTRPIWPLGRASLHSSCRRRESSERQPPAPGDVSVSFRRARPPPAGSTDCTAEQRRSRPHRQGEEERRTRAQLASMSPYSSCAPLSRKARKSLTRSQ